MTQKRESEGRALGLLQVAAAALLWSSGGLGIKMAQADPLVISGVRSLFALVVLCGALWLSLPPAKGALLRSVAKIGVLRQRILIGAFSYMVCVTCFVLANKRTTAANAILLQYTAPIYVALLSRPILGEEVRRVDWLAIGGCLLGMACFFTEHLSPSGVLGLVFALVSGVGFGLLPVVLRSLAPMAQAHGIPTPVLSLLTILVGNLLSVLTALCLGILSQTTLPTDGRSWLAMAGLGIIQIGLSYVLFSMGVRKISAVSAILVSTIEPILNPVWVAIFYGEIPGLSALLGGALIVISVTAHGTLRTLSTKRVTKDPAPPAQHSGS